MTNGINGSLFNILLQRACYGWKEQSSLIIMMCKLAYVYSTVVRFSAIVQAVQHQLLSVETLVYFKGNHCEM